MEKSHEKHSIREVKDNDITAELEAMKARIAAIDASDIDGYIIAVISKPDFDAHPDGEIKTSIEMGGTIPAKALLINEIIDSFKKNAAKELGELLKDQH